VLHSTEGRYEGAVSWLRNPRSKASAHYVIARDGRWIKLVPVSQCAWHVRGNIKFAGASVNDVSIGIELESYEGARDYPSEQMDALCDIIAALMKVHSIEAICAHKHLDPKRRSDPVGFNWRRFWKMLATKVGEIEWAS